jgi:hypothetical protein
MARAILQDADLDFWGADELLGWLNEGRGWMCSKRPDLYQASENVELLEGARQVLPDGSRRLFAVVRNVSAPRQRQITLVAGADLARVRPTWRSQAKAAEIVHYVYDDKEPGQFDVYPPARAGVVVEISYAKPPATAVDETELEQERTFESALVDYVLYRCFLKEADTVPAFHARAAQHLQAAEAFLMGDVQAKAVTSPNNKGA